LLNSENSELMKLNLVIDASSIFYRTLFTVGNYEVKKGEKLLDGRKSQGVFMRKLATDLSAIIRNLEEPSRVIIARDSSSWRKTILIDEGGYKINREEGKKEEVTQINWNAFYELTDNFSKILSRKGFIDSKIPGAEGDDLLYLWSVMLNRIGENCILITGDRDMLQTLGKKPNGTWTIALDPVLSRKKISLTQETLEYSHDNAHTSIFDPSSWSTSSDILDKLIKTHDINIVHPQKIQTMKVVLGDSGDSVPSVITWRDKKDPTKIRTMTDSTTTKYFSNTCASNK
jgi:5'-3' exonuclease